MDVEKMGRRSWLTTATACLTAWLLPKTAGAPSTQPAVTPAVAQPMRYGFCLSGTFFGMHPPEGLLAPSGHHYIDDDGNCFASLVPVARGFDEKTPGIWPRNRPLCVREVTLYGTRQQIIDDITARINHACDKMATTRHLYSGTYAGVDYDLESTFDALGVASLLTFEPMPARYTERQELCDLLKAGNDPRISV